MKKILGHLSLLFIISLFFTACDPACDGVMRIDNITDNTLILIIEKNGNFRTDSIQFEYQLDKNNISTIYGDTLLVVECNLPKNNKLELYSEGPLGTLDLENEESALFYLNEITDTIYLKNSVLTKDIKNMDNWESSVDKYNNGGGESLFEFIIENEDIE